MADLRREDERPYSSIGLVVVVGVERESLSWDEARLLLHAAADALANSGGPVLNITAYTPELLAELTERKR
jgi:hypothetical protein